MKVLGLVSSPRRLGNSELAVKEIFRQLPADWERQMIRLSDARILPCTACYRCLSAEGHACVLDDDMDFILRQMLAADKIVIASACYILGAHIGVHRFIDRLMPVMENYAAFAGKQCALVVAYGLPGWEGLAREELLKIPRTLGMKVAGALNLNATLPGDILEAGNREQLRALAEVLAGSAEAEPLAERDRLLCPVCGSRLLELRTDRTWRCVLCDGRGTLELNDGGMSLLYAAETGHRFTISRRTAHAQRLKDSKAEFVSRRPEIKARQQAYRDDSCWLKLPSEK
jgi:multimeric flavodoxin WrbA